VLIGEVSDGGIKLDLWRICLCGDEWYGIKRVIKRTNFSISYGVMACLVCYMVSYIARCAVHKFLLRSVGSGILVFSRVFGLLIRFGFFRRMLLFQSRMI
jgi:hypothetical protein